MSIYESESIELKEAYTPELKKEIVAFANTNGGTIFIGVQDNGEIVGLENTDFVMQQSKKIIKITVQQGTKKPYDLADKGLMKPSGVYVRSGTASAPASEDAIRTMIKMTDGESFENNRSLIQDLTFVSLNREMALRQLECSQVQMKNLSVLTGDDIYTNLGLLVSDQCKHLIEAYGTGISKIMSCYKGLHVQPKFENVEGAFRVILPSRHSQSQNVDEDKYLSVLRLFENKNEITRSDVEAAAGGSTTHAVNTLKEMISKDLIKK